ncbi:tRNA (adenosine(37)-N6)-threonylcarbamoyltransferase complex dimerization subunit type 1 TsaB [Balneola sp. MJW-20]|uniref:tRNA (adenosine(37)-N6)-threonylcarbamoyltransferase complex dimerization subunit type 1 TsaB n=1 Tax=Gracilimonas aurantiaca TaxID=3234185 RepID=UPI0034665D84
MILAIETATDICSVAFMDDQHKIHEKRSEEKGVHSEKLFSFTRELMEQCQFGLQDLDALLISNGPGSYTGLRIAASAVKGLLFNSEIPVYAYNTLASIAAGVAEKSKAEDNVRIHAVLNARRKHVYHQLFQGQGLHSDDKGDIIEIEQLLKQISTDDVIGGTGIFRFRERLPDQVETFGLEVISAVNMLNLHQTGRGLKHCRKVSIEALESDYLTSSQVNNTGL